jgi:hypothetical protein
MPYRSPTTLVIFFLAAGMALRLAHPEDIEFKADERWSFDQARSVIEGGAWPSLGMPMSVGGRNPGVSVWIFVGLAWIVGAQTPPELARAVQLTNCLALVGFVVFIFLSVPQAEREPWLWAAMLWAANPAAVIFERKIWPPSVLPLLTVCLIAAWWYRRSWTGSFLMAAAAAVMGQIHPVAALLPAALLLWGLAEDRCSVRWSGILLGAALGILPALPWIVRQFQGGGIRFGWRTLPLLDFYRRWFLQPVGFSAHYTLGTAQVANFVRMPIVGGVPTYALGLVHGVLGVAIIGLFARALNGLRERSWSSRFVVFGDDRAGRLVRATFWGYGGLLSLLTLAGAGAERHYMVAIAPIMALWVAQLAALPPDGPNRRSPRVPRALLALSCAAQLLVSAALLEYIHRVQVIGGAYGATWAAQQNGLAPPPPAIRIKP